MNEVLSPPLILSSLSPFLADSFSLLFLYSIIHIKLHKARAPLLGGTFHSETKKNKVDRLANSRKRWAGALMEVRSLFGLNSAV